MPFRFNIPPVNQLSFNQQQASNFPLTKGECIIVTGCPGSGKTTVANFRASDLQRENRSFKYIIYAKVLEAYVRHSFDHPELRIHESRVSTFASWFFKQYGRLIMNGPRRVKVDVLTQCYNRSGRLYDEMIFDEAQDLDLEAIRHAPVITSSLTICADDAQSVFDGEDDIVNSTEMMHRVMEDQGFTVHPFFLAINYRNTPEVYAFAKAIIPNNPSARVEKFMKDSGQRPVLIPCNSETVMMERIATIISNRRNENIGILCDSVPQVKGISSVLQGRKVEHTVYHSRMTKEEAKEQLSDLKNVVVCTNRSAKGLEFQVVIIPYVEALYIDETHRKCYYVACTRAERDLFLLTSRIDGNMPLISQINSDLYETV